MMMVMGLTASIFTMDLIQTMYSASFFLCHNFGGGGGGEGLSSRYESRGKQAPWAVVSCMENGNYIYLKIQRPLFIRLDRSNGATQVSRLSCWAQTNIKFTLRDKIPSLYSTDIVCFFLFVSSYLCIVSHLHVLTTVHCIGYTDIICFILWCIIKKYRFNVIVYFIPKKKKKNNIVTTNNNNN